MKRKLKWTCFALVLSALGGCVPSSMPGFLQKDTKPKNSNAKTAQVAAPGGEIVIQPSKIDDANASDMIQNLRREIDAAGSNLQP